MICYYVTDSITEAKDHYTMVHMQEDEEEEDEGSNNNHAVPSPPAESMRFASGSSPASGRLLQRNPLIPDISLYEDNSGLPLKFSSTSHHLNNSLRQLTNHSNLKSKCRSLFFCHQNSFALFVVFPVFKVCLTLFSSLVSL